MIWFTSDWHLDHKNIIKYSNRPFPSVDKMNEVIIDNCNSLVKPDDDLIFLGDFAFSKELSRIIELRNRVKCKKFYFIFGNHDKLIRKNSDKLWQIFHIWGDYAEEDILLHKNGRRNKVVLAHYAFRVWNKSHYGSYHLYGHSHGNLLDDPNSLSFDVGVDCWDFKPISIVQVEQIMNNKIWSSVDHHIPRNFKKDKFGG